MTKEEKLDKAAHDFSLLPEEKQDYILGVLQALAFAHETNGEDASIDSERELQVAQNFDEFHGKGLVL